jgi:tRNA threonylcarbamoyladenosine biosynthesis protein TsaB
MLLAIDTATTRAVLALALLEDGRLGTTDAEDWEAGHTHSATLLPRLEALLQRNGAALKDLTGVVVGLGPGSFTGLRVGLAMAKGLCYGLGIPIRGIPTPEALALAARPERWPVAIVGPAGPNDRYLTIVDRDGDRPRARPTRLLTADMDATEDAEGAALIEADGPAVAGLGEALLTLGAADLAAGRADDLSELVPVYVTLPRGVRDAAAEVRWSPDLR